MKLFFSPLCKLAALSGILFLAGCAGTSPASGGGSSVQVYGTIDTGVTMQSR
ncbi:hypothetical protein [Glaciimonas sp. PCH181]|uniref:hypothetical protein n=1 Tax=Glaciimonas sp. PCH181 TaxID=2133943 RepID=UPI00191C4308|nr:hypothetical protein [Glaciimonas sp. PCH181]